MTATPVSKQKGLFLDFCFFSLGNIIRSSHKSCVFNRKGREKLKADMFAHIKSQIKDIKFMP